MSKPISSSSLPPDLAAYREQTQAYDLRLATWLGLDPHQVLAIKDVDVKRDGGVLEMPGGVDVTWTTYDVRQVADEHRGRHPLPQQVSWDGDRTTYADGVHLDWEQTEQLRAEVGERPAFPAPKGGWPAHWPTP